MKKKKPQLLLNIGLIILCVIIVYPFLLVLGISFLRESDIFDYGYSLIPKNFDLAAYKYIFTDSRVVLQAYKVTAIFSVAGTLLSLIVQAMMAYPLSRPKSRFRAKNFFNFYIYFTMLFSGGLVPTYILITQYLHLDDTIWVYIIPGLVSAWNVFMMRTFFQGIPSEILDSAYIDGADEFRIFSGMVIPLSKPVLATLALNIFLGKWNDWSTSLLYINLRDELISLQYLLQRIMLDIDVMNYNTDALAESIVSKDIPSETIRMAMAVVVAGPALFIFPFFQKYFVKGMVVGSVKG